MASPSAYISTYPQKYGCKVVAARSPIIYEIACVGNIDVKVDIGGTDLLITKCSPGADGLVKIDIQRVISAYCDKLIHVNHLSTTILEDSFSSGYATFSYKDEDDTTYTDEIVYYIYAQNPVTDKYEGSCNNLKEAWVERTVATTFGTSQWANMSSITGFETFNGTTATVTGKDNSALGLAASGPIRLTGSGSTLNITMPVYDAVNTYAMKFQLLNSTFEGVFDSGFIFQSDWAAAGGVFSYPLGAIPAGVYNLYLSANGQFSCTNFTFTWALVEGYTVTDALTDNYNGLRVEFQNNYDFDYAGAINVYLKCPIGLSVNSYTGDNTASDLLAVVLQQLDENGNLTSIFKWYGAGADFVTKDGMISFTKTGEHWMRVLCIYDSIICDVGFIESSPYMTGFNRLLFYNQLPMDLSVNAFVNLEIGGSPAQIEFETSTTPAVIPLDDTVTMINLNYFVDESTTIKMFNGNDQIGADLTVTMIDCLPRETFYVAWKNVKGGFDYYCFKHNQSIDFDVTDEQDIEYVNEWGLNVRTMERINEKRKKIYSCGADNISNADMDALASLFWSPVVFWLSNPTTWKWEGEQWLQVKANKKTFVRSTRYDGGSIEVDFEIMKYNY